MTMRMTFAEFAGLDKMTRDELLECIEGLLEECSRRDGLIRDLYTDLVCEGDGASFWFRKYAKRVNDCGVDVSRIGAHEVADDVELYGALEAQEPSTRDNEIADAVAAMHRQSYADLLSITKEVGMDFDGGADRGGDV